MSSLTKITSILFGLLFAIAAYAAPHYEDVVLSDSGDGDAMESFPADTAKIFVRAHMIDIPSGAKMTGAWIAVDTNGVAPPNFKIDSADLTAGGLINVVTFSLSKPTKGWPLGKYRVEMSINGKVTSSATFEIE